MKKLIKWFKSLSQRKVCQHDWKGSKPSKHKHKKCNKCGFELKTDKLLNRKGFTLIELIVVIAIIGLIISVAVPKLLEARDNAREITFNATVRNLEQAAMMHIINNGKNVIWSARGGDKAGIMLAEHESWYLYLDKWPQNPLGTGDFVVEIVGNQINITPRLGE